MEEILYVKCIILCLGWRRYFLSVRFSIVYEGRFAAFRQKENSKVMQSSFLMRDIGRVDELLNLI